MDDSLLFVEMVQKILGYLYFSRKQNEKQETSATFFKKISKIFKTKVKN